jgi:hypothetical protein
MSAMLNTPSRLKQAHRPSAQQAERRQSRPAADHHAPLPDSDTAQAPSQQPQAQPHVIAIVEPTILARESLVQADPKKPFNDDFRGVFPSTERAETSIAASQVLLAGCFFVRLRLCGYLL